MPLRQLTAEELKTRLQLTNITLGLYITLQYILIDQTYNDYMTYT